MALPTASDNVFPKVIMSEGAAPATPSAGEVKLYAKTDGLLYSKDDAGAETALGGLSAGTAFPGTPSTNDRFFRTDDGLVYFYDGTRWVSETLYNDSFPHVATDLPLSATQTVFRYSIPMAGTQAIYAVSLWASFFVTGGTALGASHKWVLTLNERPSNSARATINIDSGASDTWRTASASIAAAIATTEFEYDVTSTKTGTPGTLYFMPRLTYRLIQT